MSRIASRLTYFLSILGAITLGVFGMWFLGPRSNNILPSQSPLIELEKMGDLATVKINYSDVIEFTEKRTQEIPWTRWELSLGGTKVLLVAKGDCVVATNFKLAKYVNIDQKNHTLSLTLQQPKSLSARINHDSREKGGSYFYAINNQGLEVINPDSSNRIDAINNGLKFAQAQVERVCTRPEVVATARKNTEELLSSTFKVLGWKAKFLWE
jgi:hypothetical protein